MKILKLTLRRKWFDMILRGEKAEEYRDIKTFWTRRFMRSLDIDSVYCPEYWDEASDALLGGTSEKENFDICFKDFDAIEFYRGAPYFGEDLPRIVKRLDEILVGFGRPELGAPTDKRVFILKLGETIEIKNCNQ